MRKSQILSVIENELNKATKQNRPLAEIKLIAHNQQQNKDRLAYCILNDRDQLETLRQSINTNVSTWFSPEISFFDSIQNAKLTHTSTMNDSMIIENNWRGRLFDFQDIENLTGNDFNNFLLRSVWRIIVQRDRSLNYFVRHDIYPYFWSPGHSTGGDTSYEEQLTSSFWNVTEPKFNRSDIDFDFVKLFANRDGNREYQAISFSPTNANTAQDLEFSLRLDHVNKQQILRNILANIQIFFA